MPYKDFQLLSLRLLAREYLRMMPESDPEVDEESLSLRMRCDRPAELASRLDIREACSTTSRIGSSSSFWAHEASHVVRLGEAVDEAVDEAVGGFRKSPVELIVLGKAWLADNLSALRLKVCSDPTVVAVQRNDDPIKLIITLSNVVMVPYEGFPTMVVAAILLKIGLDKICQDVPNL